MQEYNPIQTEKVQAKQPKYAKYKSWLMQNGVLMDPRVRYPTCFGKNLIGVSAKKPIQKNRAIIAVPYKLLITVDKVKNTQTLKHIIKQNPDIFSTIRDDCSFMILLVYVCYQLMQSEKSFYYPYFQIADSRSINDWTHWDVTALQNKDLVKSVQRQKDLIETHFMVFLRIFRRYDKVFPESITNNEYKKIFQQAYSIISTRAFGWSLPSISLIPLADSFNHGHVYVDHYLVDVSFELKQDAPKTYIKYKSNSNLSILNIKELTPTEEQLNQMRKVKLNRKIKFIKKHKQILQQQQCKTLNQQQKHLKILTEQYNAEVHNLRQLHFYQSSCSEDNDTDEETLHDRAYKQQTFMINEKLQKSENNIEKILKKYWEQYRDYEVNDEQEMEIQQEQHNIQSEKKELTLEKLNAKNKESEGSSSVSSTSSQEQDEYFDWFKEANVNDIYFIMQTRQIVKQDNQLYNFYGRRSNKFLLLGYNFATLGNIYDSFAFRLKIDSQLKLIPEKIVSLGDYKKGIPVTRQIRLKQQRVNQRFISHCRCLVIQSKKDENFLKITIPFNVEVQNKSLDLAIDIVTFFIKSYMTTMQEDQQLLQKSQNKYQIYTAIKIRYNHKKILQAQRQLLILCKQYLKKWKNGKLACVKPNQMSNIRKIRGYLCQLQRGKL